MRTNRFAGILCRWATPLALLPVASFAHHTLSDIYDRNSLISVSGTITATNWVNPHAVFLLDVAAESGDAVRWRVEMDPPGYLDRKGVEKSVFAAGAEVTVIGYQSLDCSAMTEARMVMFADGSVVEVTTEGSWNWRPAGSLNEPEVVRRADCD